MRLRLIILARNGRAARNLELGSGKIALAVVVVTSALTSFLWLGWKIGERF